MAFKSYASYYDLFYKRKDYQAECDFVETLFRGYAKRKIKTLLDLGCGTASHLIPFIERGYQSTGIDASSQMLRVAHQKLNQFKLSADLKKQDLASFHLEQEFDAVVCLFSVVDYLVSLPKICSMLKRVYHHLKPGGLFVFDFWHAPAVVHHYTPSKSRVYERGDFKIERRSKTRLFPDAKKCEVTYFCKVMEPGKKIKRFTEKHSLRYFSVEEMKDYLEESGFKVVGFWPFMNLKGKIKKNTWDVTAVGLKE